MNLLTNDLSFIDNVCIDALSVNIDKQIIETGSRNLSALGNNVSRLKTVDAQRLQEEYQRLVSGMITVPYVYDVLIYL